MPYEFKNNTYSKAVKENIEDKIDIEIGDSKQPDFYPQLKLMRWDNEANVSIRLIHDEKNPFISDTPDKISWIGEKIEAYFYDIPDCKNVPKGGQEFDIVLKEKPLTNKIQFSIQSKGVEFSYQPFFHEEKLEEGQYIDDDETHIYNKDGSIAAERNANVNGSYAIYLENNKSGDFSRIGGKNYRAGKLGHIYRPKIFDANGNWVWGELLIENGIMTVTIPQKFLDEAVYPIRHAAGAEFGVTSVGGTGRSSSNERGQLMTLSEIGTVTELHGYSKADSGTVTYNMAVYDDTAGGSPPAGLKGYTAGGSINTTAGWHEYAVASNFQLPADTYYIVGQADASYQYFTDSGGSTAGKAGYTYPFSDPHGASSFSTSYKISLHAVYTTGGTTPSINNGLLTLDVGT